MAVCFTVLALAMGLPTPDAESDAFHMASLEVTVLLQQGKDDSACADLAKSLIDEVTDKVDSANKQLALLDDGSDCSSKGQDAVVTATTNKENAEKAATEAASAASSAADTEVDFGSYSLNALTEGTCAQFWSDPSYTAAKKTAAEAATAQIEADAKAKAAEAPLQAAQEQAAKDVKACQCAVRASYNQAYSAATQGVDADAAAYTKGKNMQCVLAGTAAADCKVGDVPKLTEITLAEGVPATPCTSAPTPAPTPAPTCLYGLNGGTTECATEAEFKLNKYTTKTESKWLIDDSKVCRIGLKPPGVADVKPNYAQYSGCTKQFQATQLTTSCGIFGNSQGGLCAKKLAQTTLDAYNSATGSYKADLALNSNGAACTDPQMQYGCIDLEGTNWCNKIPNYWGGTLPGGESPSKTYNFNGNGQKYYGLNVMNSAGVAVNYLPNNVMPPNTHLLNPAWWKVDFATVYIIDKMMVWNKEGYDWSTQGLRGATVSLGQQSGDFLDCGRLVFTQQRYNDNQDVCHKKMGNSAKITTSGLASGGTANSLCVYSFVFKGWSVNAPINPSQRPSTASTDITDY